MSTSFALLFMRAIALDERPPLRFLQNRDWSGLWQIREHLILRAANAALHRGREL